MSVRTPFISVIVVNYNSGDKLKKCIEALSIQTFKNFETIVIDNDSFDNSMAEARKNNFAFREIFAETNLGFAVANNRAAEVAVGEWLAFLNPDAYAEPHWLKNLVAATNRHPNCHAFGSTQINADFPSKLDGAGDAYHVFGIPYRGGFGWPTDDLPLEGECFAPCAAAALYRTSTFEDLKGFSEHLFCYGEDVDLGFRHRLQGGNAIQVPSARVYHEGSGITGRHSDFTIYYGHRNRIWVYFTNMPLHILFFFTPFHLLVNSYLLIKFTFVGGALAYLRAMKDGFLGLPALMNCRKKIQKSRSITIRHLCRSLTWSPIKLMRREVDIKIDRTN